MSAPSWIRRLSETDENHGSTFELPQISLYTSGSRSNLSQISKFRSNENLTEQRRRESRDSNSSYGNMSEQYYSRTFDRRRSSEDSNSKFGTLNSGYVSEFGSSTIRSNPNSHGDLESVASSKYTTTSGSKNRLYASREPKDGEKSRYKSSSSLQATPKTKEPNREQSWSYVDSEGYARLPVSTI
ncbi:hypothetical protein ACF0H5_021043 [Mactra antiquata]